MPPFIDHPCSNVARRAFTRHATDHRLAVSPATRDRVPDDLIDEVDAATAGLEVHQAFRLPHPIKNYLKKPASPRFINRACRLGRRSVDR